MLYPSIDELKKRVDSRYTLVMLASKRARDLIDHYPALVDIGIDKPVSIATEEIAEDMITYSRREIPEDEMNEPLFDEAFDVSPLNYIDDEDEAFAEESEEAEEDE